MKVVQINTVCQTGSTGRIVYDISKMLTENNIENYIFYGQGKSDYILAQRIGNDFDFRMHQILSRLTGKHGFYSKQATYNLIKKIKEINPDVIHLHNIHGFYLHIGLLFNYLKQFQGKVIWTFHDCWPFTGHCAYFDYVGCDKWKKGCYHCPQKKAYPKTYFKDNSKNNWLLKKEMFNELNNLTICTPSKWLANIIKDSYLSSYPIVVIPNGVDLNIFHPTILYKKHKKPLILAVANIWEKRKGLNDVLRIAQILKDECDFLIVGKIEENQSFLENISYISRTENILELTKYYSMADVFINTTYEDNFPTTNLEALACGTPIITYNTGGSGEAIIGNVGYKVKKGNIYQMIESIHKILKLDKYLYSKECIKVVQEHFNKFSNYNYYINLYMEVKRGQ